VAVGQTPISQETLAEMVGTTITGELLREEIPVAGVVRLHRLAHGSATRSSPLLSYRLADGFHGFADRPLRMAERISRVPCCFVGDSGIVQVWIVGQLAGLLFDNALERLGLAFQFVAIHVVLFQYA
jgi:hypothetical protein